MCGKLWKSFSFGRKTQAGPKLIIAKFIELVHLQWLMGRVGLEVGEFRVDARLGDWNWSFGSLVGVGGMRNEERQKDWKLDL
jgi:hypothetical protein